MGNRCAVSPLSCLVTTSYRPDVRVQGQATQVARKLKLPFVDRDKKSLEQMYSRYMVAGIVVVSKIKTSYHCPHGEFFFHPDKSAMRIKEIRAGKTDQMIKAMDLYPGCSIVDCTLGLATDAIVASYVSGIAGKVVGIESSPIISTLVEMGLKSYEQQGKKKVVEAMRRVRVLNAEHGQYLTHLAPNSFDVVYFDPMFRKAKLGAHCPVDRLRPLADHSPLERVNIELALQVARRRVVMKETRTSQEFDRLGVDFVVGGKHSPIQYGVWVVGSEGNIW